MTDSGLFSLFLFLHIFAAIVAFGPTFIFSMIAAMARKEPAHLNFAIRLNERLVDRVVLPFALSLPVTGLFLIYFAHLNLLDKSAWWLDIAIVLYVLTVSIAIVLQRPTVARMVELTSRPPAAPAAGAPSGPPPELRETGALIARNGAIMGIGVVLIVLLMVIRPQF